MQFHVLSFEGPEPYARAGGIASRIEGLVTALGGEGHETHLWFVGDPHGPVVEQRGESLHLHRWSQWISAYHPGGVYDGEDGKERDFAASLPPFLVREHIAPAVARGEQVAVLAEEWHTANAVLHLHWLLEQQGLRDRVLVLWNANNTFGFDRIDWAALARSAVVTTVSRYMRQRMWGLGVDPIVIPNGLGPEAYARVSHQQVGRMRHILDGRTVLTKVARFDPDKRWLHAVRCVAALRDRGARPLLIARGGAEGHGHAVLQCARDLGLRIGERAQMRPGAPGLVDVLRDCDELDVLLLASHVDAAARRVLFRGVDAVLANSAHEPFGLVGLEAMAAGGIACTGGTGEDYAIPGRNALVLQTDDPAEFLNQFDRLRFDPAASGELRRAARRTAFDYAWRLIVRTSLLPRLGLAGSPATGACREIPDQPEAPAPSLPRWSEPADSQDAA